MAAKFDWRSDPIVQIETKVERAVSICAIWLVDLLGSTGETNLEAYDSLQSYLEAARDCLSDSGKPLFAPLNVDVPSDVVQLCHIATMTLDEAISTMRAIQAAPKAASIAKASTFLRTRLAPNIQAALDGLRGNFISTVVGRQAMQRTQADLAIKQVRDISKKIFFISINASVEAARAGDAGRGFSVISQEIRTLSQTAKSAVDDLSNATQ